MRIPDTHLSEQLNRLIERHTSFCMYRLPWTDECHFILQAKGDPDCVADYAALNGKKGFVFAPFRVSATNPIVVFQADYYADGWDEITTLLTQLEPEVNDLKKLEQETLAKRRSEEERLNSYEQAFLRFKEPLESKQFKKLVLSRYADIPLSEDFYPLKAFVEACNNYPRMMIYLCHTPATGTWMGSTPEILLNGQKDLWHTVALAGTIPFDPADPEPVWSKKNREEQALVADYIRQTIKDFGTKIVEEGPYPTRAGNLLHLKTEFSFHLKDRMRLGDFIQALHPTPAVCGYPKAETYQFIAEQEGYDRHYYSGFLGRIDPNGTTNLYVNLRCMEVFANFARLYAGGGILPSSELESEWTETQEKMKTMKKIL